MTSQSSSPTCLIGTVRHPQHGAYNIFYNVETGRYGLSKRTDLEHCAYASLAALFTAKGI